MSATVIMNSYHRIEYFFGCYIHTKFFRSSICKSYKILYSSMKDCIAMNITSILYRAWEYKKTRQTSRYCSDAYFYKPSISNMKNLRFSGVLWVNY